MLFLGSKETLHVAGVRKTCGKVITRDAEVIYQFNGLVKRSLKLDVTMSLIHMADW
jgi:hypothetical protein